MTLHAKSRMHDLQRYPLNVYLRPRVFIWDRGCLSETEGDCSSETEGDCSSETEGANLRPRVFIWDRGCLSETEGDCLSETEGVYLRPRVTVYLRPRVFIWHYTYISRNSRTYTFNFCDRESNIYIFWNINQQCVQHLQVFLETT